MSDRVSFGLVDAAGVPLTGATPSFVQYRSLLGVSRTPPTITELGGGQYGFTPTDDDEATRVAFLIDCGAASSPRRYAGAIHTPANPFLAWHLEDSAGALWAGANPSVGVWRDFAGNDRTPPSVLTPGATSYLFAVVPSTDDLQVDVAFRLDSPSGAYPEHLTGSVEAVPWSAPSPGPLKNPAQDIVSFLDGKVAGGVILDAATNLFAGPMRSGQRTPAPAVFVLNTGGGAPEPYLSGSARSAYYRPTVQVMVRGPAGDIEAGEELARGVLEWLSLRELTGYVSLYAQDSAPAYLGDDASQHGQWSMNFQAEYRADLG